MKRKRPNIDSPTQGLVDAEHVKKEANLAPAIVDKSLTSLVKKKLIKQVPNIQNKRHVPQGHRNEKVATAEGINDFLKEREVVECTSQQVAEILNSMGDALGTGPKTIGPMASIPHDACPRTSLSTPDGIISPQTCVYYTKWLNFEF
ncbi:hypothetical protein HAX54_050855 [Datura stramonium]|uniref:Uncharacterized protein n=1 Tax=Datura stramonium TaxID=4076 RepID=A0ABS8SWY6_DATST|nr:hypothetical protein [Datura stramonium]